MKNRFDKNRKIKTISPINSAWEKGNMKKRKGGLFVVIGLKTIKLAVCFVLMLVLLACSFGGAGALAEVFFNKENRKLPIYCVGTQEKKVALTFDAAWGSDKTESILSKLKEYDVTATFFLVGMWVDQNSELVKKIDEQGIEIGTHSDTHPDFTKLSTSQMKEELEASKSKITGITGKPVTLFRAPFGAYNNAVISVAESVGLKTIQWDADSLDWKGIPASTISKNVLKKANCGSIILCHNNALHTVEALDTIIPTLKQRGYTFVTVSNLLFQGNYTIDHTGRQKCA